MASIPPADEVGESVALFYHADRPSRVFAVEILLGLIAPARSCKRRATTDFHKKFAVCNGARPSALLTLSCFEHGLNTPDCTWAVYSTRMQPQSNAYFRGRYSLGGTPSTFRNMAANALGLS